MAPSTKRRHGRPVAFLVAYDEQTPPSDLVIPEDLTALSDDDLSALTEQAEAAFNDLYADGADLSADDLDALTGLADGIDALHAEQGTRAAAAQERADAAAALAARVRGEEASESTSEEEDEAEDDDDGEAGEPGAEVTDEAEDEDESEEEQPESLAASARREVRVNLSGLRSRQARQVTTPPPTGTPRTMRDVVMAAPDVPGYSNGQGMDFSDLGRAVDARLTTFNKASYERAALAGRHVRQQFGIATIRKPFEDGLRIDSNDPDHVEAVFARACDETRLPGGSLVASGGWCAPSETLYDLFEMESRDGLFSLPEVNVSRGGIRFSPGPDFATLFADITGFHYTEAQDIAGDYAVDSEGVGTGSSGSKPCYKVDCPDFDEVRLDTDGLCITAGLLQRRGYPEAIARTIRGALVAHDHRMSARKIASVITGSTAVTMPASQVGATAPILTAIELQVEHYRDTHRLPRSMSLEAVFPFWVHGAVRSDLSRRLGVDLFDVSDARIAQWFRDRGVNPQFVYNWQGVSGGGVGAAAFTQWPATVSFLLYAAGTWVGGGSDVITLDTVYDSVLLGENDYTALFTEEGWLVAKRGHDSRVVTVNICADGATHGGVLIDCGGGASAGPDETDPTPGTVAASSITNTTFTLTISGASDTGGLDAEPYRVSTDGGATWSQWQTSGVFAITGKTADTDYAVLHEVRDEAGNVRVGNPIVVTTTNT